MHREENMKLKLAVIGLVAFGSAALSAGGGSAMPNGLPATADTMKNVEHVRWVCNPWDGAGGVRIIIEPMVTMEGRVSMVDRVTTDAAGAMAAAGAAGTGRIAREGNRPPFSFTG